jgi:hypothetical protein
MTADFIKGSFGVSVLRLRKSFIVICVDYRVVRAATST